MNPDPFISFPPKTLAPEPRRVPVLWNETGAIALNKPAGIPAFQDSKLGGGPRSLLVVMNDRATSGSQFSRFGIESVAAVHLLEREASGVLLFAKDSESRTDLKNALGSLQFVFRYRFLSVGEIEGDETVCELPVAVHREKPLALISHKTGKKTVTRFHRLKQLRQGALWESESAYDRFHQVRLHAAETGIPLLGDPIYGNHRSQSQAEDPPEPFFLHLATVSFPWKGETVTVEAPEPQAFRRMLRKLGDRS